MEFIRTNVNVYKADGYVVMESNDGVWRLYREQFKEDFEHYLDHHKDEDYIPEIFSNLIFVEEYNSKAKVTKVIQERLNLINGITDIFDKCT